MIINLQKDLQKKINLSGSDKKIILFSESDGNIDFVIEENSDINLTLLFLPSSRKTDFLYNIIFNLKTSSNLKLFIANLSNINFVEKININLNGEFAAVNYYSACILNQSIQKDTYVTIKHLQKNTYSNIKTYEIIKNKSQRFIRCVSDIVNKSVGSEAHQDLRLLVLDKEANAASDPVLLIDENDIIASHANAIGMLDPDQLFYLQSRGLNGEQARELIINGYFEPIFHNLNDKTLEKQLKYFLKGMI